MKYLVLLISAGDEKPWSEQTEAEQVAAMAKFGGHPTIDATP